MAQHAEGPKPSLHLVYEEARPGGGKDDTEAQRIVSFDNTKAGLQKVDKKQVEEVIENLSKGSHFYNNKKRKRDKRQKKIEELLLKEKTEYQRNVVKNPLRYKATVAEVARIEAELLEQTPYRDMEVFNQQQQQQQQQEDANDERRDGQSAPTPDLIRIFVHVDMDMFYAAVEEKKDPQLKNVPFAVGGMSMLSTSNYIARQYGVRSGMPGFIGKRLCPELRIIPTDYKQYEKESVVFQNVCRQYDEQLISMGWDELTMEIGPYVHAALQQERRKERASDTAGDEDNKNKSKTSLSRVEQYFAMAAVVVNRIRAEVCAQTGMTCSAGIGISPTFAKFASNVNKPNGQLLLPLYTHEAVMDFLRDTSVREMPGIGESTEHLLHGLGIRTMGDIYREKLKLYTLFTRKTFLFLFGASLGVCGMFDFFGRHQDEKKKKEKKEKKKKKREGGDETGEAGAESASSGEGSHSSATDDSDGDPDSGGHSRSGGGPPDQHRAYDRIFHSFSRKSVGHEHTFHHLQSRLALEDIALRSLRDSIGVIHRKQLLCGHLVLKLKHVTFEVKQYSKLIQPFPAALAAAAVKSEPCPEHQQQQQDKASTAADPLLASKETKETETASEMVYEFENKYFTDQYEVLKYNLYALLSPVVEHYAQYRLLGVRLEKLISKVHLCAYQKWFAHTPAREGGVPNQKTLRFFFQQRNKRGETTNLQRDVKANKERLYYTLSESGEEDDDDKDAVIDFHSHSSSSSSSSAPSSTAPEMGDDMVDACHYVTVSSSSPVSRNASTTLEHYFKPHGAKETRRQKQEHNVATVRGHVASNEVSGEDSGGCDNSDDDDDVVIIE